MDLLVVRHAIAYERDRKRWPDDGYRPLTPEGMTRARKAAAGLKRMIDRPDIVLASPLKRAQQTATILERSAGWPEPKETSELAPDIDPLEVIEALSHQRGKIIAVVGHEPGLSQLIALCLIGKRDGLRVDLKKPGVACLTFEGTPAAGRATLKWFVTPQMLRAFA